MPKQEIEYMSRRELPTGKLKLQSGKKKEELQSSFKKSGKDHEMYGPHQVCREELVGLLVYGTMT